MTSVSEMRSTTERFVQSLTQCSMLGISVIEVADNHLVLELPYQPAIVGNPDTGILHGGAITTLMDTACGSVMICALPEFELCPTLDLRVDYMRPAAPGYSVRARAHSFRVTPAIVFVRCEAYQSGVGDGSALEPKVIAHCVATFMRIGREALPRSYTRYVEFGEGPDPTPEPGAISGFKSPLAATEAQAFSAISEQARRSRDVNHLIRHIPYAEWIGLEGIHFGEDVRFRLSALKRNLGNPVLPAIHGGVLGGAMELSAALQLLMKMEARQLPRIVDFSLDYLRAGMDRETYIECDLVRQGNRVTNVIIHAWQTTRSQPIALARAHFLLGD